MEILSKLGVTIDFDFFKSRICRASGAIKSSPSREFSIHRCGRRKKGVFLATVVVAAATVISAK
jgi:hypothetical protein